jgi:hypothetical protein
MLACNGQLGHLPLATLAEIAFQSRVRRYVRGAKFELKPSQEWHFLLYQGQVRLFDRTKMDFVADHSFGPHDFVGADLARQHSLLLPEVASEFAIVLHVPPTPDVSTAVCRPDVPTLPGETRQGATAG